MLLDVSLKPSSLTEADFEAAPKTDCFYCGKTEGWLGAGEDDQTDVCPECAAKSLKIG